MNHYRFSESLDLGFTTLKNRFVMGSMHTGMEEDKDYTRLSVYFKERARGGVALIITGGIAPDWRGALTWRGSKISTKKEVKKHHLLTETVHQENTKIAMQILHAGRYGFHPFIVGPSRIQSPITPFTPWALSKRGIRNTIKKFVRAAQLAQTAEYDGVEIMGSEGYLINQFLVENTNQRKDEWGGSYENRMRFPLEIVKSIREKLGEKFIIIYRLSLLDLIPHGSTWEEIVLLARRLEQAGVTLISTGIGWHESRIPTIAAVVPRGHFTSMTQRLKTFIQIPLITANRINDPLLIEKILSEKATDLVSLARPLLADPEFANKAMAGEFSSINTCIACNQACLDRIFEKKLASCLVNPRAGRETELIFSPAIALKQIAVVGAGPAGITAAFTAAQRGHRVTLFEKKSEIGGQLNMAKHIPNKGEFFETLRYYAYQLKKYSVKVILNHTATVEDLNAFDEIILATGVVPRWPAIPGIHHPMVLTYIDVLYQKKPVGKQVAIIGAGGIGFDLAEYLVHSTDSDFDQEWGIDKKVNTAGGLRDPEIPPPERKIFLLQRKASKLGAHLGKTTGWIHRKILKNKKVKMIGGVSYQKIDDSGLHLLIGKEPTCLKVDTIVLCAGQLPLRELAGPLSHKVIHIIGGAAEAKELDAERAVREATELGLKI